MTDYLSIVYVVLGGLAVGAVFMFFQKNTIGGIVRKLVLCGCDTEERAKSATELKISKFGVFLLKSFSKPTGALSKYVLKTDDGRYYIPADKAEEAKHRYDNRGSGIGSLILTVVLLAALALAAKFVMPLIVKAVNGMKNTISGDNRTGVYYEGEESLEYVDEFSDMTENDADVSEENADETYKTQTEQENVGEEYHRSAENRHDGEETGK